VQFKPIITKDISFLNHLEQLFKIKFQNFFKNPTKISLQIKTALVKFNMSKVNRSNSIKKNGGLLC